MKNRCLNPAARDYRHYGARGIRVCRRWLRFDGFIADMGPKPDPSFTLERRRNGRGYSKSNCYWGTRSEQSRNRRFVKRYRGKTTWEWAEQLGIKLASFHLRLWRFRRGYITEAQLFAPVADTWKVSP